MDFGWQRELCFRSSRGGLGPARVLGQPDKRYCENGFRVGSEETGPAAPAPQTVAAPPPTTPLITPTVGAVALKDGFTNTLGMKFMNVPGTKVLILHPHHTTAKTMLRMLRRCPA